MILIIKSFFPGVQHNFERLDSFRENLKKVNGTDEEDLPSYVF